MTWTSALKYFPLKARAKTPITAHGFKDATSDPETLTSWSLQFPGCNWGIATGEVSGIVVIDIDPRNGGSLESVIAIWPEALLAPRVKTGGGGWHLYCAWRPGIHSRKLPGVDIKSDGGYVVAEGSIHPSGNPYVWEFAAEVLPDFPATLSATSLSHTAAPSPLPDDITDMLAAIPPDDYETWTTVAMGVQASGHPDAFRLWNDWSKASKKYPGEAACLKKWHSFGPDRGITIATVVKLARDHGYSRQDPELEKMMEAFSPRPKSSVSEPASVPFTPTIPVPMLEAVRRWAAPSCDPVSAIAVALTIGSLKVARTVRTTKGDIPSLFLGLVAPSATATIGVGNAVETIIRETHLTWALRGGNLTSDDKLKRAFLHSAALFHFSHAWASMVQFSYRQPSGALGQAIRSIETIYHGGNLVYDPDKGKGEEPIWIFAPSLAMIAGIGSEELPKLLSHEEMGRGSHEMMLYIPMKTSGDATLPPVENFIKDWFAGDILACAMAPSSAVPPDWRTLAIDDSGYEAPDGEVFRGYRRAARRIALILTACADPDAGHVCPEHLAWAFRFVAWCAKSIRPEDAGGEGKATVYEKIVHFVRKKGTTGASLRDISNFVWDYRQITDSGKREKLLQTIIEDGFIATAVLPGQRKERYFHRDFIKVEGATNE